jgi:hypothetical protein
MGGSGFGKGKSSGVEGGHYAEWRWSGMCGRKEVDAVLMTIVSYTSSQIEQAQI